MGSGETITSKAHFKEWLWELACVEIRHYQSDNGVFTSEDIQKYCNDKNQEQWFSGVGAHHQNAHAELEIKTFMLMARIFMLHVALH